jgi:hypothetical protein
VLRGRLDEVPMAILHATRTPNQGGRMNESAVRQLAQSDPLPNLSATWTDTAVEVRRLVDNLNVRLRELDKLQATLAEHDITVDIDLGPIGNAARSTRRDLERDTGRTFEMPR